MGDGFGMFNAMEKVKAEHEELPLPRQVCSLNYMQCNVYLWHAISKIHVPLF